MTACYGRWAQSHPKSALLVEMAVGGALTAGASLILALPAG